MLARPSRSSSQRLRSNPPPKPVSSPRAPTTRWQGTMMGIGFFPLAAPTARVARTSPKRRASSPIGLWSRVAAPLPVTLVPFPSAEQASQQHELSQVIGVVVGEHERLAQYGLSGAVRDPGQEIGRGVAYQALHRAEVVLHLGDALVPRRGVGRRVPLGPVARRPLR